MTRAEDEASGDTDTEFEYEPTISSCIECALRIVNRQLELNMNGEGRWMSTSVQRRYLLVYDRLDADLESERWTVFLEALNARLKTAYPLEPHIRCTVRLDYLASTDPAIPDAMANSQIAIFSLCLFEARPPANEIVRRAVPQLE